MSKGQKIEALQSEEEELQFPYFDAGIAWQVGVLLRERAAAENLPIAIEVSTFGQQLFFAALPGATPDNADWVRRKRAVVERFRCSSLLVTLRGEEAGRTLIAKSALCERDFANSGGAFPVILEKSGVVGAVTVSGLTQFDDHALAVWAIRQVIATLSR